MSGLFKRLQDEIDARDHSPGLSPVDLLDLPTELVGVIQKIIRRNGLRLTDIAEELNRPIEDVQESLDELVAKGFVRRVEVKQEVWYKAHFGRKADKKLSTSVWSALDQAIEQEE